MVKAVQKESKKKSPAARAQSAPSGNTRGLKMSRKTPLRQHPGSLIPDKHDLVQMLFFMMLQRKAEERIFELYKAGKIVGGMFSGRGMEAIPVGSAYALEKNDVLFPMFRDLGALLVRGVTLRKVFCQYLGNKDGPTRGRDGNMHMGEPDRRIFGMISHLGAMIPVAAGAALAGKMQGENICALAYIGDGGTSAGDFHEGLNIASVLKVPMVVIIENNQYAYSTPSNKQYACKNLVERAAGYGIPGYLIDGNDVLEVYRTTRTAILAAKEGRGPTLIEAGTMRMPIQYNENHKYLPEELVRKWLKKDPIDNFKKYLRSKKILTEKMLSDLDKKIESEIDDAVRFAEDSPLPDGADADNGVYAG